MNQIERIIGPYEERKAVCQDYDHRTVEVAQRVAVSIRSHLPGVNVEHIGSTSVPGCAGKGIVDLMLVYPDGQLAAARDVLDALGFQRQTTRDPFPEDRPMRTGSVVYDDTIFLLHVHVIAASSPEAQELRHFRDRLRADPDLVASYVAAKKAILASSVTDSVDYCMRKGEFVERALRDGGRSAENGNKADEHQWLILDQFTKQAIPFSQMPDHSPELILAATEVGPTDTVLDVACGPGVLACAFAQIAHHVTGIDLTPAMIDQAKAFQQAHDLANLFWRIGHVLPLPFADASFSLVFTRYSFHHFLDPKAVLAEMVRVCSPGGRVVVVDVFTSTPDQAEAFNRMEKLRDPSHVRALSLEELTGLFHESGLHNIRRQFYKHEFGLEAVLKGSFPNPGDAEKIRQLFEDDLGVDYLGLGVHRRESDIHFAYPIVILVGDKPSLTFLTRGSVCGCAKTAGTCRELLRGEVSMFLFAFVDGVEPTNNAAERALRHGVLWRKMSNGPKSVRGSEYLACMWSVVETCRQQGRGVGDFLTACMTAAAEGCAVPSLLAPPNVAPAA